MLLNFCDKCLRTDVTCSTINTEGYEVTNLVNDSGQGFLAYSAIKPPVHIDFVFICNIKVSYVIIWPQIGAQKSSGFQLSVKSTNTKNESFTDVSTAFIKKEEQGVFFYRRDVKNNADISAPSNFAQRYIKAYDITNFVSSLRISILKTDNSVPALGKIEIWGQASPRCGKDVVSNVMTLWTNKFNNIPINTTKIIPPISNEKEKNERIAVDTNSFNVPEEFLDSITYEIMTQPIILPSGKIIDQKTLEKHGQTEAIWGRPASDPFTGVRFNDNVKPIAAIPLKTRIDKFLLENSNQEEIKKLPRVLGSKNSQKLKFTQVITCNNIYPLNKNIQNNISRLKRTLSNESCSKGINTSFDSQLPSKKLPRLSVTQEVQNVNETKVRTCTNTSIVDTVNNNNNRLRRTLTTNAVSYNKTKKSFYGHLLPLVVPSRSKKHALDSSSSNSLVLSKEEILKNNALIKKKLDSRTCVNSMPECNCCTSNIFYKLPCGHVICRKALMSLLKNECTECKKEFKTSDPQRYHLSLNEVKK